MSPIKQTHVHINRRRVVVLLLALLVLYIVVPRLGDFRSSLHILSEAQVAWVGLAIGFALITYGCAALIYCLLALEKLGFARTLLVQFASMFANRLLPAGIGAIGVNYEYVRHHKHTAAAATAVVFLNNTMGFVGHLLLLLAVFLVDPKLSSSLQLGRIDSTHMWIVAVLVIALALALFWFRKLRAGSHELLRKMVQSFSRYRTRPLTLILALIVSLLLTVSHALCLWASAHAVGTPLSAAQAFIVLSAGIVGATITPTPGGLIGVEAALTAGLIAFGVPAPQALAIALLHRLVTYWFMLLAGAGAFVIAERRGYLG